MNQDKFLRRCEIEILLARNCEIPTEVKTIRSLDKKECFELKVFDGQHLLVSHYSLHYSPTGQYRRTLIDFVYSSNCVEDVMNKAVFHYGCVIAGRYHQRLADEVKKQA